MAECNLAGRELYFLWTVGLAVLLVVGCFVGMELLECSEVSTFKSVTVDKHWVVGLYVGGVQILQFLY